MTAYTPEAWDSFFVAEVGASAALAGLLFVGVSINLSTIAKSTRLVRRVLEAFVLLVEVLLLSSLMLVPDASTTALGWGAVGVSVLAWAIVTRVHRTVATAARAEATLAPRGSIPLQIVLGQAATIPFIVGSITLSAEAGGGLSWFVPGTMLAFVAVLLNAWVLLIEIER